MVTQITPINLIPGQMIPRVNISQYDTGARVLKFSVYNGEAPFTFTNAMTVALVGTKPDGKGFSYAGTIVSNMPTFDVTAQMSAVAGKVRSELVVFENGERVGSGNFVIFVEECALGEGTDMSESDYTMIDEAIEAAFDLDHFYADLQSMVNEAVEDIQVVQGQTVIDPTLSISGAAADAKVTGDKIKNLYGALMEETVSGEFVTIDDGAGGVPARQIVADIAPQQNLNGYDRPWLPGAGKNLLPVMGSTATTSGITYTYNADGTVTATGEGTANNVTSNYGHVVLPAGTYLLSGCEGGASNTYRLRLGSGSYSGTVIAQNYNGDTEFTLDAETDVYLRIYIGSNAGQVSLTFMPMIRLSTETDATYMPYSNVCPITGVTEATITQTGKNIARKVRTQSYVSHGITFTMNTGDDTVIIDGTSDDICYGAYTYTKASDAMDAIPFRGMTLTGTAVCDDPNVVGAWAYFKEDGTYTPFISGTRAKTATFVVPDDAVGFRMLLSVNKNVTVNNAVAYLSLTIGEEATNDRHKGGVHTITFPSEAGTVYGGTLTLNDDGSGTLVVDRAYAEFDGSQDEGWTTITTSNVFRAPALNPMPRYGDGYTTRMTSNEMTVVRYNYNEMKRNYPSVTYNSSGQLFIAIGDDYTTAEQATAWLQANPLQIAYYTESPIATYGLTAPEVETVLGTNYIYMHENGTLEVTYRANTAMYVDKKIAELQALVLENQ